MGWTRNDAPANPLVFAPPSARQPFALPPTHGSACQVRPAILSSGHPSAVRRLVGFTATDARSGVVWGHVWGLMPRCDACGRLRCRGKQPHVLAGQSKNLRSDPAERVESRRSLKHWRQTNRLPWTALDWRARPRSSSSSSSTCSLGGQRRPHYQRVTEAFTVLTSSSSVSAVALASAVVRLSLEERMGYSAVPNTTPPPLRKFFFGLGIMGPSCKFGEKKLSKFMKHAAHSGTSRFKFAKFAAQKATRGGECAVKVA